MTVKQILACAEVLKHLYDLYFPHADEDISDNRERERG